MTEDEEKAELLLTHGWCRAFKYRIHGWPYDDWYYAFVGQTHEPVTLREDDWLTLEDAYEAQMYAWEE